MGGKGRHGAAMRTMCGGGGGLRVAAVKWGDVVLVRKTEDSPAGVPGRGGDRRSGIGAEDAMVLRNASDASEMTRMTRGDGRRKEQS
jgi:hypothetical protein